jgi:hypothetical protein
VTRSHTLVLLALLVACTPAAPHPTPSVPIPDAPVSPDSGEARPADTDSAPALELQVVNDGSGSFSLHANRDLDLASRVSVERLRAQAFSAIPTAIELALVEHCAPGVPAPACVHLTRGQTFTPVPWTGYSCSGQCNQECDKNIGFAPGDFRFVVTTCDGSTRFESPPFHLGPRPR